MKNHLESTALGNLVPAKPLIGMVYLGALPDGAIVGSSLKDGGVVSRPVSVETVCAIATVLRSRR